MVSVDEHPPVLGGCGVTRPRGARPRIRTLIEYVGLHRLPAVALDPLAV